MDREKHIYCRFGSESLACERCGYKAKSLPTFRVCKTIAEMAEDLLQKNTTHRIHVPPLHLGAMATKALSAVGITKERVSAAIGKDCGCTNRAATLDYVGASISRAVERAANYALNFAAPSHYSPEEVAEIANAIAASEWVNPGLRAAAARHVTEPVSTHTTGNPPPPPTG